MNSDAIASPSAPDLGAVFEFHDNRTGLSLGVYLATLLQCLCIAEQRHLVPPLEPDWEAETLPPALREMSRLDDTPAASNGE
ncbi:hypothetical protein [Pseudomonas aeruginosa]|uniref:hypothetical protein n=1 Tax=Pseudomonas aeruginosa TaxID=287 RepID=UPI0034D2C0DF